MKVSELVLYLEKYDDESDVFVKDENNLLHEFKVEHREASFDGFDEVTEEGLNIILTD